MAKSKVQIGYRVVDKVMCVLEEGYTYLKGMLTQVYRNNGQGLLKNILLKKLEPGTGLPTMTTQEFMIRSSCEVAFYRLLFHPYSLSFSPVLLSWLLDCTVLLFANV